MVADGISFHVDSDRLQNIKGNGSRDATTRGVFALLLLSSLLGYPRIPWIHLAVYNFLHPLFAAILIVLSVDRLKEALRSHSRMLLLTLTLYGWIWISALFSDLPAVALRYSLKYLIFVLVFVALLTLTHGTHAPLPLYRVPLRFLTLLAVFGIAEYLRPGYWTFTWLRSPDSLAVYPRISSLMQGPNQYGTLMSLGLLLSLLLYKGKCIRAAEAYVTIPLFVLVLSLSGSRNAWIVLFLGIFLAWAYRVIHLRLAILLITSWALCLTLIPIAMGGWISESRVLSFPQHVVERAGPGGGWLRAALQETIHRTTEAMTPRLLLWKAATHEIAKRPFTGIGIQTFGRLVGKPVLGSEHYHTHSILMNVAVETGLPGLLLFLGLMYSVLARVDFRSPVIGIPFVMVLVSQLFDYYMHDYTFTPLALYFTAEAANSKTHAD